MGHQISLFSITRKGSGIGVAKCFLCGAVIGVVGKGRSRPFYRKTIGGSGSRERCPGRHLTVDELVERR